MLTGTKHSDRSPEDVAERLRMAMAAGNYEILEQTAERIRFVHGTYLTQTAAMLPKHGSLALVKAAAGTRIDYEVTVSGFARYWIGAFGILFCWLIFPAIVAWRALCVLPRRQIENLLQAL